MVLLNSQFGSLNSHLIGRIQLTDQLMEQKKETSERLKTKTCEIREETKIDIAKHQNSLQIGDKTIKSCFHYVVSGYGRVVPKNNGVRTRFLASIKSLLTKHIVYFQEIR